MSIPKGAYTGECNRGACVQRPALYWNQYTFRFYCVHCARKLNRVLQENNMQPLIGLREAGDRPSGHVGAQHSE